MQIAPDLALMPQPNVCNHVAQAFEGMPGQFLSDAGAETSLLPLSADQTCVPETYPNATAFGGSTWQQDTSVPGSQAISNLESSTDASQLKPVKRLRRACSSCNTRKVKCDQQRPMCASCMTHGHECFYQTPPEATVSKRSQKKRDRQQNKRLGSAGSEPSMAIEVQSRSSSRTSFTS